MSGRDQLQYKAAKYAVEHCCGLMSGRDQLQFIGFSAAAIPVAD